MSSDDRPKALLTDFGISRVLNPGAMTVQLVPGDDSPGGTVRFMAKEMLYGDMSSGDFYTKATDVWAFGMTIYVWNKSYFFRYDRLASLLI